MGYQFRTHLKQLVLNKAAKMGNTISQREVAEQTGISLPAVNRWFSGKVDRIEADTAGRLCVYLGCEMTDLVSLQAGD